MDSRNGSTAASDANLRHQQGDPTATTTPGHLATPKALNGQQGDSSSGSKGRTGGSRLRNLLSKFGKEPKSSKPLSSTSPTAAANNGSAIHFNTDSRGAANKSRSSAVTSQPQPQSSPHVKAKQGSSKSRSRTATSDSAQAIAMYPVSVPRDTSTPPAALQDPAGAPETSSVTHHEVQRETDFVSGSKDGEQDGEPGQGTYQSSVGKPLHYRNKRSSNDYDARSNAVVFDDDNDHGDANYEDDDGADPDASIRPITPSSIDASSSFTGSMSVHSMAPTSRTFKSFITGHSKTSASTKPQAQAAVNGNGVSGITGTTSHAASPPLSSPSNVVVQNEVGAPHDSTRALSPSSSTQTPQVEEEPLQAAESANMREAGANRIATSLHRVDAAVAPVAQPPTSSASSLHGMPEAYGHKTLTSSTAKASPLRMSFVGPSIEQAVDSPSPANGNSSTPDTREQSRERVLPSSSSITFSHLPPSSPAFRDDAKSIEGSPVISSAASIRSETNAAGQRQTRDSGSLLLTEGENVVSSLNYPRHSVHNPKNNPRASSPPPDNASMLTLASSTGVPTPSIYTNAPSRYASSSYGDGKDRALRGSTSYAAYLGGSGGGANEDASIRAIPPSRRDSNDSLGSRWSAAVLSSKDYAAQGGDGGHTGTQANNDDASYRRRTPSLKTVATTSSYYAAPQAGPSTSAEVKV